MCFCSRGISSFFPKKTHETAYELETKEIFLPKKQLIFNPHTLRCRKTSAHLKGKKIKLAIRDGNRIQALYEVQRRVSAAKKFYYCYKKLFFNQVLEGEPMSYYADGGYNAVYLHNRKLACVFYHKSKVVDVFYSRHDIVGFLSIDSPLKKAAGNYCMDLDKIEFVAKLNQQFHTRQQALLKLQM